jgi:hypothetical protein
MAPKTRGGSAPILPESRLNNEEGLGKLRNALVPAGRRGANVVRPATFPPNPRVNETVMLSSFALAGLIPPFSAFFLAVLEDFNVHLLHLAPNSVMMLAVFAHLCEMFVGVMPSVALFRHYYALRPTGRKEVVGSCCFRLRDGVADQYISQTLRNKWEDWRQSWCYIEVDPHPKLLLPTGLAKPIREVWEDEPAADGRMQEVLSRITGLGAQGLTATMVVGDYLRRRLAPLRERGRPAWIWTGITDHGRTAAGPGSDYTPDTVYQILKILLGSKVGTSALPRADLALCVNSLRDEIRRTLPEFDARGIRTPEAGRPDQVLRIPEAATAANSGVRAVGEDRPRGADDESPSAADPEARAAEEARRKGKKRARSPTPPPSAPDSPPAATRAGGSSQGGSTTPAAKAPEAGVRAKQWRFSGRGAP